MVILLCFNFSLHQVHSPTATRVTLKQRTGLCKSYAQNAHIIHKSITNPHLSPQATNAPPSFCPSELSFFHSSRPRQLPCSPSASKPIPPPHRPFALAILSVEKALLQDILLTCSLFFLSIFNEKKIIRQMNSAFTSNSN